MSMITEKIHLASSAVQTHHIESMLRVLIYIDLHLDEKLSLQKLSTIANISPYYFHRLFHTYLSMPPGEYIKYTRLTAAAKRLQYSRMSITDIAFAVGYEDTSSFTRAFLQLAGKSPRIYRKEVWDWIQQQNQSIVSDKIRTQPSYVYQEEKIVFFRRKIGDYKKTVIEGIQEWQQDMMIRKIPCLRCFGIALDDPLAISRTSCRFDICVNASASMQDKGYWGKRKLLAGKYAVFIHRGSIFELEEVFTKLFYLWHTNCKDKLRFSGAFCEYSDLPLDAMVSSNTVVTAKYYVPLLE